MFVFYTIDGKGVSKFDEDAALIFVRTLKKVRPKVF